MKTQITILTLVLLTTTTLVAGAATYRIKDDGTGDAATIQDGMNTALSGDTLLLAPGTFTGTGNVDIDFGGKDVVVVSEGGPAVTIIDMQGNGRAFLLQAGESSAAVISGLTLTNAAVPGNGKGGAVFCNSGSPTVENNIFINNNSGGDGAGFYAKNASPTVRNNRFENNSTNNQGGAIAFDTYPQERAGGSEQYDGVQQREHTGRGRFL
jgi:hypothetical protein